MKLGLFGGSFDPPHRGHVQIARAALESLALDRIDILPTARPPHKRERRQAPALARLVMAELAFLGEEPLRVSAHETVPERVAYTIDTVTHYRATRPDDDLTLLVGADSFAQLPAWRRWEELIETVRFAVLSRPGWTRERLTRELPESLATLLDSGRAAWIDSVRSPVSSTELRAQLGRGERPTHEAVDPLVLNYIEKYKLYR